MGGTHRLDTNRGGFVTELHVHDWTPWTPSPLSDTLGVERHRRVCRGCELYQDEPTPQKNLEGASGVDASDGPITAGDQPAPKDAAAPESAIEAVTAVVRDLFRYPCADPQTSGATQELIECGACAACTRDWTPEAEAILAAAVPYIERAIRDKIAAAEALHAPKRLHPEFRLRPWCEECSTGERTFHDDGVFTHRVYWPCRTAQALGMVDPLDPARVARGGEATK
jgi:hypothetical protein